MQPEIHLGPITLQTFGIMFALAFIAAGALVARRLNEWGKPADWAYELILCAPGRRHRRRPAGLHRRELRLGQERPARQRLLRLGTRLVRRRDRRRDRRWAVGVAARHAQRRPPRPLRGPAGAGLRDWPDRLPALRRRRLRQGVGRPLGDGLPERHQADRPDRSPDADLRDPGDGPRRLPAVAAARPLPDRSSVRHSTWCWRGPSASWSSSSVATITSCSGSRRPS